MTTKNESNRPLRHVSVIAQDLGFFLFLSACVVTCGWAPNCNGSCGSTDAVGDTDTARKHEGS